MMKQNENEMNFSVLLEIIKASEIEPKEVSGCGIRIFPLVRLRCCKEIRAMGKAS